VVAILSAIAGAKFDILSSLNGFPRIPIGEGTLTTGDIITAIAVALIALLGAILGGGSECATTAALTRRASSVEPP